MKRTGHILSTLVPIFLLQLSVAGADAPKTEAVKKKRLQEAKSRLELTDEQVELVVPILKAGFQSQKAILEAYGLDIEQLGKGNQPQLKFREARRLSKDLDAARAKTLKKLEGVLSPGQVKVYEQLQSDRRKAVRKKIRSRR